MIKLGSLWDQFALNLGSTWDPFAITLGFWNPFGIILELLRDHFGITLRVLGPEHVGCRVPGYLADFFHDMRKRFPAEFLQIFGNAGDATEDSDTGSDSDDESARR